MRLGTQTGSLVNHVLTSGFGPEPYVGMPATICYWTDREPATVVEVNMKKRYIVVQDDDYKRVDSNGMSESQVYEYTQNPENHKRIYRKNKKGVWVAQILNPETGRLKNAPSGNLYLGEREKFYDFSF